MLIAARLYGVEHNTTCNSDVMEEFHLKERQKTMKTRKTKRLPLMVAACMVALVVCGCRVTRVCNSDGGMEISQTEGASHCIRSMDACFNDGLSVESTSLNRNSLGFLAVTVALRNLHGDPEDYNREDAFSFEYKFAWFDKSGMEIMPDSYSWIRKDIGGGAMEKLSMTAPTKEATTMILRLRHAR